MCVCLRIQWWKWFILFIFFACVCVCSSLVQSILDARTSILYWISVKCGFKYVCKVCVRIYFPCSWVSNMELIPNTRWKCWNCFWAACMYLLKMYAFKSIEYLYLHASFWFRISVYLWNRDYVSMGCDCIAWTRNKWKNCHCVNILFSSISVNIRIQIVKECIYSNWYGIYTLHCDCFSSNVITLYLLELWIVICLLAEITCKRSYGISVFRPSKCRAKFSMFQKANFKCYEQSILRPIYI